jgi:hypothetical protein
MTQNDDPTVGNRGTPEGPRNSEESWQKALGRRQELPDAETARALRRENTREWVVELPVSVCDAYLEIYLGIYAPGRIICQREQSPAGRVTYAIHQVRPLGYLNLWQLDERRTCIMALVHPTLPQPDKPKVLDVFASYAQGFLAFYYAELERINREVEVLTPRDIAEKDLSIPHLPPTGKPKRGGPIEAWLDWRISERAAGRRWTLEDIADESGYSVNVLKKRSAARRTK